MNASSVNSRRTQILAAIACAIGLLQACTVPESETEQDITDGVRNWVSAYETAWNTHDAAAVGDFFSEDADLIVGNGPRIEGRNAVKEVWQDYFDGIDDARKGTFEIESMRAITPDVLLININSTTAGRGPSADRLPARLARGTWIIARHDKKWQISVFRAFPAVGDVRSEAGRDR